MLYADTFEKYQGLDLFIEGADRVIEKCDDVHFLLVGGTADQIVEYRKQVEQKGLSDYLGINNFRDLVGKKLSGWIDNLNWSKGE